MPKTNHQTQKEPSSELTNFGYHKVSTQQKTELVAKVFDSVAQQYDLMNDLMSLGIHRYWKKIAIDKLHIQPHFQVLDLAGGTGDLSSKISQKLSSKSRIVLGDINHSMVEVGRSQKIDLGQVGQTLHSVLNAEKLPFADKTFDRVVMAFGLRNVTDKKKALEEIKRILKHNGQLLIVEFSQVKNQYLKNMYDWYSFNLLPKLGECIVGDSESYQYLSESIRMHPNQEELTNLILQAGFSHCQYENFQQGIVAMHHAIK